jgi:cytochrome c biogenesis protein CcdA
MLRLLFSLVFIGLGLCIIYVPSITNGADVNTRLLFGALMIIYGSYRFLTFWWEYKKIKRGEDI